MTAQEARSYIETLATRVLLDHGIDNYWILWGTAGSYHRRRNGRHEVRFGQRSIDRCLGKNGYTQGWTEYKTIANALGIPKAFIGQDALHRLTLHECAHAIQVAQGQRYRGSVHNQHFVNILRQLYDKYPCNGDKMYTVPETAPRRTYEWFVDNYAVGDTVQFEFELKTHFGTVKKIGAARVVVGGLVGGDSDFAFSYDALEYYSFRHFEIDLGDLFD